MKQYIIVTSDDLVLHVCGFYDAKGNDTDDPLKAETLVFEGPDSCHYVTPCIPASIHVIQ